jgi:hypothetical protein
LKPFSRLWLFKNLSKPSTNLQDNLSEIPEIQEGGWLTYDRLD